MKQKTLTGWQMIILATALAYSILVATAGYAYRHSAEALPIQSPRTQAAAFPTVSEDSVVPVCGPTFIPTGHRHDPPLPPHGENVWTPTRGWCFMTEEEKWPHHRPRDDVYSQPPYYSMSELLAASQNR